jgi:hypothetical protein
MIARFSFLPTSKRNTSPGTHGSTVIIIYYLTGTAEAGTSFGPCLCSRADVASCCSWRNAGTQSGASCAFAERGRCSSACRCEPLTPLFLRLATLNVDTFGLLNAKAKLVEGDLLANVQYIPSGLFTISRAGSMKHWVRPLPIRSTVGQRRIAKSHAAAGGEGVLAS